jgi:hypothetical protein
MALISLLVLLVVLASMWQPSGPGADMDIVVLGHRVRRHPRAPSCSPTGSSGSGASSAGAGRRRVGPGGRWHRPPETMIPIIAIVFGGEARPPTTWASAILGAPFIFHAGDVRHRRGRHLLAGAPRDQDADGLRDGARPRHPLLRGRHALAIGTAFLPPELGRAAVVVAAVLIGISHYVKGRSTSRQRSTRRARAAAFPPGGSPGIRHKPATRLRVVGLQVLFALACIIGARFLFVGRSTASRSPLA